MAKPYEFFAHFVEYDGHTRWEEERDEDVEYEVIAFRQDPYEHPRSELFFSREVVYEGRVRQYDGPVNITLEDYGTDDGIETLVLTRDSIRVIPNEAGAEAIEETEVLVTFEIDEKEFATLRRQMSEMFADFDGYREEIA